MTRNKYVPVGIARVTPTKTVVVTLCDRELTPDEELALPRIDLLFDCETEYLDQLLAPVTPKEQPSA